MTEKDYKIRILELSVAIQSQSNTIEILTRTVARLYFELSQLPGGMDIIKKLIAEIDDDDDEFDLDDPDISLVPRNFNLKE